jgi:hypothetical protein
MQKVIIDLVVNFIFIKYNDAYDDSVDSVVVVGGTLC